MTTPNKTTKISKQVTGIYSGKQMYIHVFSISALQNYNLIENIEYNKHIFTNIDTKKFPLSFLELTYEEDDTKIIFYQDLYTTTLDKYIDDKIIKQAEALVIFQQVLKSIYSLSFEELIHRNIRPEHFAQVNGIWKLRSAIWSDQINQYEGEYAMNPSYQSPQEFTNTQNKQLDLKKVVVWNLGSLILDMLLGVHRLKDMKTINKWKDRQFSLQALKSNVHISNQLKTYLCKMLHFNPEHRYSLEEVYENDFFSKQVSNDYKKFGNVISSKTLQASSLAKSMLGKSLRGSSLGKSLRGSSLGGSNNLLRLGNQQIYNIIPIEQIDEIDKQISRDKLLMSKKNAQQIQDQDDFFDKLNIVTKVIKKKQPLEKISQAKSEEQETIYSNINIENDEELRNIFSYYKTFIDRSELLFIAAKKISEIPFQGQNKQQIMLLNEFSIYYVALIELNRIAKAINANKNIYKIKEQTFHKFINSKNFKPYRQEINKQLQAKEHILEQIVQRMQKLPQKLKKNLKRNQMLDYIQNRDLKNHKFQDIKKPYRQVLKMTYDLISNLYNSKKNENYCRLSLYAVYCLTIDKLYIDSDLKDNFSQFIEWSQLRATRNLQINKINYFVLSVGQLQKYFQTAPIKTLIMHSKRILKKYYKI